METSSNNVALNENKQKLKFKKKKKFTVGHFFASIVLVLFAISILYPIFWMVVSSMKTYDEIYNNTWGFPEIWQIQNYATAWEKGISNYFINSLIITITTILCVLLISSMAAYALVRYKSKIIDISLIVVMIGMMLNPQVALIPLYSMLNQFNLLNTRLAMILPYIAFRLPLSIMLLRSYFLGISNEIVESALMDGCSEFRIFRSIYLPMSRPILVTITILTAYYAWNEFMFATIFISTESLKTIPSGLMNFRDALQTDWGVLLAGMVMSATPMIIMLVFLQKYLMRGLSEGSVKG